MKKLFSAVTSTCLCIPLLFSAVGCGEGDVPPTGDLGGGAHTCEFSSRTVLPTCTQDGYTEYVCECGESYREDVVPASGHSFENYSYNNNATCLEDGDETSKCTNCDETDTRTVPDTKTGHAFSKDWTSDGSGHWHGATCEHAEEKNCFGEHTFGSWRMTKEPTRTEEGEWTKACWECNYKERKSIATIDYDYTEGLYYELNEQGTGYVVSGAHDADDATVAVSPATARTIAPHCLYKGLPVVAIHSFQSSYTVDPHITEYIERVIVPQTVQTFASFANVTNLKDITVSENNPYFSDRDGVLCSKDGKTLYAFPKGRAQGTVTVPAGVEILSDECLSGQNITQVNLPEGLIEIGDACFPADVYIPSYPSTLVQIGTMRYPFGAESTPQNFNFYDAGIYKGTASNPYLIMVGQRWTNVELQSIHPQTKYIASHAITSNFPIKDATLTIPDSVEFICDEAFYDGAASTVYIGKGVKHIGENAFYRTNATSNRTLSVSVSLENATYCTVDGVLYNKDKTELVRYSTSKQETEYSVLQSCTKISAGAFVYSKLERIEIPSTVREIGYQAFECCQNLQELTVPEGVERIESRALRGCSALQKIYLPSTLAWIGYRAFSGNDLLTEVHLGDASAWFAVQFEYPYDSPFNRENASSIVDALRRYAYEDEEQIFDFVIPSGVEHVREYAFYEMTYIQSVVIPKSVKSVGTYAFPNPRGTEPFKIFYEGTQEEFDAIDFQTDFYYKWPLSSGVVYIYSEEAPLEEGNWWHYDENGSPSVW